MLMAAPTLCEQARQLLARGALQLAEQRWAVRQAAARCLQRPQRIRCCGGFIE